MKSPFPGMDPYLEQFWRDVHQRLTIYFCDMLQPELPEQLRARVEERVFVESDDPRYHSFFPDIHVVERVTLPKPAGVPESDVAVEDVLVVHFDDEPVTQGYIEIVEAGSGNRVVTVIEFLSPSNKIPGDGRDLYLRKQQEVKAARVSLVEIDLTRTGRRVMAVLPEQIRSSHRTTYQVCIVRGWATHQAEVYRVPLDRRLPVIHVPLRETDADVPFDLQVLIDRCYQNGRYDDLNYQAEPIPPLDASDAEWADELLQSKGLR